MSLLKGKKALILGIANDKSIAWGITQSFIAQGAKVGITYLNEQMLKRVEPLADEAGADFICELDVTKDEQITALAKTVEEKWGKFDIIVHSLAFADREDLKRPFSETSRAGFSLACDVSAYSLIAVARELRPLLNDDASIISMSYHGSQQVMKGYNVMGVAKAALEASTRYLADDLGQYGIRVNSISAGPIRTLAASGVPGLRQIFQNVEENAPLKRNITTEDVGGTAVYLGSDLSKAVTGQILYVDAGFAIMA